MTNKRITRPVSIILTLMLLAGIFCAVPAFAEEEPETPLFEPTKDWGADGVFEIANASDLLAFSEFDSDFAGETVKLTANIDLNPGWTAAPGSQAEGNLPVNYWVPVQNFKGTFDGQNFSISGMFIYNDSVWDNGGLFAKVDGATIKNLVIKNSYMFTNHASGGVAACVENNTCTFENIYVDTIIEPKNPQSPCCYVGGIVGRQTTAGANYINCVFAGSVTGREAVGGIVGATASDYGVTDPAQATVTTFKNCVNLGNVAAVQYEGSNRISGTSGGIVGRVSGNVSLEGCINLGTADTANGSTNRWVSGGAITVLDASNSDNNTASFSHTVTFKDCFWLKSSYPERAELTYTENGEEKTYFVGGSAIGVNKGDSNNGHKRNIYEEVRVEFTGSDPVSVISDETTYDATGLNTLFFEDVMDLIPASETAEEITGNAAFAEDFEIYNEQFMPKTIAAMLDFEKDQPTNVTPDPDQGEDPDEGENTDSGENTTAPDVPTEEPTQEGTDTPDVSETSGTDNDPQEDGCASFIGGGTIVLVALAAGVAVVRRKED